MKKCLVLTLSAVLVISAASAQKLSSAKVPVTVKNAFAKAYPGQSVKWEKEKDKYEAGFKQNGADVSVLYTAAGVMTESETDIKITELPVPVLAYIKNNLQGKPIKEAAKITTAAGVVTYEAEAGGEDLIFDSKGTFLKKS
jgi:opacity protein-like surface antigen